MWAEDQCREIFSLEFLFDRTNEYFYHKKDLLIRYVLAKSFTTLTIHMHPWKVLIDTLLNDI